MRSLSLWKTEIPRSSRGQTPRQRGAGHSAGNAKWALKVRFLDAQGKKRREFEHDASAGEEYVKRDEPLESQTQAKGPTSGAGEDCHPGRVVLRCSFRKARGNKSSWAIARGSRE